MLGQWSRKKELLVAFLCMILHDKLGGNYYKRSIFSELIFPKASQFDYGILWLKVGGSFEKAIRDGTLNLCHHKFFRRLDIIISSIGVEKWRGAMPIEGDHGFRLMENIQVFILKFKCPQ